MNISDTLPTEAFDGPRYTIIAWCRGHEVLFYREFGSYQGDWVMLSYCDGEYNLWRGCYGSCSGCDHYEASLGDAAHAIDPGVQEFVKDYLPFLEVPAFTMRNLASQGYRSIGQILPANMREEAIEGYSPEQLAKDVSALVKLKEELPIYCDDILQANDQEVKQRMLKLYGYERFCVDAHAKVLDASGENSLLAVDEIRFLSLKDSSTDRRYLLRVPPHIERTKEGIAWTFGLSEEEYAPLIET